MKKIIRVFALQLLVGCLGGEVVKAQHTQLPQIAGEIFTVTDFGAIGDGKTLNTVAIQAALNKAKGHGGTVVIPAGQFLCGPLFMYSKTNLEIKKDAVLRLRNDIDSFPFEKDRYLNFITISGASDVKISGEGTIDGQGEIWWKKYTAKELVMRRPQMLVMGQTERIEIAGVTFLNPPNTHVSLKNTSEVYIHDITIKAPADSRNTDGLNISVKNCTIEKCTINTGDDNIAINFGNKNSTAGDRECRNIVIKNCTFGYGHGLSIGSYTSGGLKNLLVSNCTFDGTTSAIRIKTAKGRGGIVEDIVYTDIKIRNSKWPIFISKYYPKEPATPQEDAAVAVDSKTPVYKNIMLKNIDVDGAQEGIKLWGLPESPIEGIKFINVKVKAKKAGQVSNVKDISFSNSYIAAGAGEKPDTWNAELKGL